jgi:signal-transduction protein with cAMP-binding, CBS, and nucleotidyltransferase domain
VRQQLILKDLPESLRQDVRQNLFKNIIENWDVILDNQDNGVLSSIIQKLELRIIPQEELIIKYGEIAQEMYFIIKGQVNIISSEGIHLAQIGVGKNFGEMALLQEGSVRSATV